MAIVFTRRQLMRAATATALAGTVSRIAFAQRAAPLEVSDLAPDLVLIRGAGVNVVALSTNDGVLLVDGGLEARSADVLAVLEQRWPGRKIALLFNTNWRDEHIGANAIASRQGAKILAHENTKLWIGGDFFVEWEDRHYSPRPAAMLPNATFYTSGKVALGGTQIDYRYVPRAHTDGDVAVFFPDANVLVASDLVSAGRYPVPDYATGGWIGGLLDATQALLDATDARTRIVAADGGVLNRAALEAQRELCAAVKDKAAAAFRSGMSFKDFAASKPTAEFDAKWGNPDQFLALVYKGGFAHLRELGGVI